MNKTYLAYGSNMNLEQMEIRCPQATVIGSTILEDHRLRFRGWHGYGVATIEPCQGSSIPVLLWEITAECEKALDRYEGFPYLYRKTWLEASIDGMAFDAMAYVMNGNPPIAKPSTLYYRTLMQGYKDIGLDDAILYEALKESVAAVTDANYTSITRKTEGTACGTKGR